MSGQSKQKQDHIMVSVKNLELLQHSVSLQKHSNVSSNIILEEVWSEHSAKLDAPDDFDTFNAPISLLIPKKCVMSNVKKWKSNLKSFGENFEVKTQCQNVNSCANIIDIDHLDVFLRNTHEVNTDTKVEENPLQVLNTMPAKKLAMFKPPLQHSPTLMNSNQIASKPPKNILTEINYGKTNQFQDRKSNDSSYDMQVPKSVFKSARDQLIATNPAAKRSLGTARKSANKFISPMMSEQKEEYEQPGVTDDRLKHIDPKMVELIQSEIIDNGTPIEWDDIAGLQTAKSVIQEAVVWPLLRPDIFTGLRRPPKGVLLFGPPGTGKTLIGKCVASQCRATFFNISASSLTSKWIGDGEKMVRALFAVARTCQPAVVFVDEIDSLLSQRGDAEHEATRRIKTEFLVQFDGAGTGEEDRILVIGATNRPQELDEAARRRLVKRLYIPLPDQDARKQIINNLLRGERHTLSAADVDEVSLLSAGWSGADMRALCAEAAMGPVRAVPVQDIHSVHCDQVRAVSMADFRSALRRVRPSVSPADLEQYVVWNATFGFDR